MCLVTSVCVHTYMYVCIYIYIYIYVDKNRLFSALLLQNLLLSVICCLLFEFKYFQCGLLRPASYTDRAIHAFPNKMQRPPWPRNSFFLASFNAMPHPLCYNSFDVMHVCNCMQTGAYSAECQQLVWEPAAHAALWNDVLLIAHRACVLWNSSFGNFLITF